MRLVTLVSAFLATVVALVPGVALAQKITDPQIAHIVVTANQVDIDGGKLASTRATNPEVRKFAELMVTDHTGVNKLATDLATRLKVTPEDNPTSQALKTGGEKNVARLKTLSGAAFDKAYVDHEVAYHQQVLEALDKTLVPAASNSELKALLVKVRPAFVAHLEHAKKLQKGAPAGHHVVTIADMRFQPATISVAPGDTVTFVNKDIVPHTATSTGVFDSQTMDVGASWRHTFRKAGEFGYTCSYHPTMAGVVRAK